ncbi:MAG: hypothetical protein ACK5JT_11410 [Hyphomicrobiaceae bacterium]
MTFLDPQRLVRTLATSALIAGAAIASAIPGATAAKADRIRVVIDRVTALDNIDPAGGKADFFARVTIGGDVFTTKAVRRDSDLKPTDWVFTKRVRRGLQQVKIEIFDKDVLSKSDAIDINRVGNKRDLDFTVNTRRRPCRLPDFAGAPRCGHTITRAGGENRRARISFRVEVLR